MKPRSLLSDQLYTWSDSNVKRTHCRFAKTPPSSPAPTASAPRDSARFPHRTLQTMWKAGMQMRRRPRPRPQVLSVGELSWPAAANGLRPAGVSCSGGRVPRQLPSSPRDLGGHLRDQPRTAAPPGDALKECYERNAFPPPRTDRSRIGRRVPGQYARQLARRRPQLFDHCGGR